MKKQNNYPKSFNYATRQQLFLAWLWHYDGTFTNCGEIQGWMQHEEPLQMAKSVKDLKQRMALNPVYEKRHYHKVDVAYQHFQERLNEAGVTLPASVQDVRNVE